MEENTRECTEFFSSEMPAFRLTATRRRRTLERESARTTEMGQREWEICVEGVKSKNENEKVSDARGTIRESAGAFSKGEAALRYLCMVFHLGPVISYIFHIADYSDWKYLQKYVKTPFGKYTETKKWSSKMNKIEFTEFES